MPIYKNLKSLVSLVSGVESLSNKKNTGNERGFARILVGINGGIVIWIWLRERQTIKLSVRVVTAPLLCTAMQIESFAAMNAT